MKLRKLTDTEAKTVVSTDWELITNNLPALAKNIAGDYTYLITHHPLDTSKYVYINLDYYSSTTEIKFTEQWKYIQPSEQYIIQNNIPKS